MKKPELHDFGLDEKSIAENKRQHDRSHQLLEEYVLKRKSIRKTILIISIVAVCIIIVSCLIIGFNNTACGILLGLSLFWMVTYGVIYFQYSSETSWDISYDKKKEIEDSVVDKRLEQSIANYNRAIDKYEESLKVNEHSVIEVEMLLPDFGLDKKRHSLGITWMCFSNIHLANPQYYPNINANKKNIDYDDFESYYKSIIEMQKSFPPEPKKDTPIPHGAKLEFYYPCSDAYLTLKGKKVGDIVELPYGVCGYKILQVFND